MGDRGGQLTQRGDSSHVGKLGAGVLQGLLGNLALRHVLNSPAEQGSACTLLDDTGDATQVLRGSSGGHNPKYEVDVRARHRARDHSVERRLIVGVDEIAEHLHCELRRGIDLADAKGLLGPDVDVRGQICDETARLAQPLSFGKIKMSLRELRLYTSPVIDIRVDSTPPDDVPSLVSHRSDAEEKPAKVSFVAAQARFRLSRFFGS